MTFPPTSLSETVSVSAVSTLGLHSARTTLTSCRKSGRSSQDSHGAEARGWESWVHSALWDDSAWTFLLASAPLGEGVGKREWVFLEVIISHAGDKRERPQLRKFWLVIQEIFFTMKVVKPWNQRSFPEKFYQWRHSAPNVTSVWNLLMLFECRIEPHDLQCSPLKLDYFVIQDLFGGGKKEWILSSILFKLKNC